MTRNIRNALMLGVAAIISSTMVLAQSAQPAAQTAVPTTTPAAVPADQQPTPEQLAKLFDVMRIRVQMQSVRQMLPAMISQQIKATISQTEAGLPTGTKLTPGQRAAMDKVMNKYVGKAMDLYPPDEMVADMTRLYQQHLTRDDVDAMIVFYNSTSGRHLLDAQPVITREYMPLVMGKVTERSQALTREMMKEMAEIVPTKQGAAQQGNTKPTTK
ncbi:MAG: DUF2059 domain-containing protein [Terracidiphilus sp.]